jgi:hypothetical protein
MPAPRLTLLFAVDVERYRDVARSFACDVTGRDTIATIKGSACQ